MDLCRFRKRPFCRSSTSPSEYCSGPTGEPHVHHDLQYLFLADPARPLVAQVEEVHAAAWKPVEELAAIAPRALARIAMLAPLG